MKKSSLLALAIGFTLIFSFNSKALAEEGLTDTEIHIGSWGAHTGPAAAFGATPRGTEAYFKMINEEGGIHGRKIVFHQFDDGYNPAKTKAGVKQLQESSHGIFAWVGGTGTASCLAVKDYLMERKIPWVGPSTASSALSTPPNKYLFTVYPPYDGEARILMRYAVENFKNKRFAIVYQNDEYGKTGLRGAEEELASFGSSFVTKIPQNVAETDVRPVIMKLRKEKAEVVLLWVSPSLFSRLLGTSITMKYYPQWMTNSTGSDVPMYWKMTRGAVKGVIVGAVTPMHDSQNALFLRYKRNAFDKFAVKGERWGVLFLAGIAFAEPIVEALYRAGPDLTREGLIKELEGFNRFQGITARVTYRPFDPNDRFSRVGSSAAYVIQYLDNGDYKILSDWIYMAE